jgi:methyl-accepting chemotaxis protein
MKRRSVALAAAALLLLGLAACTDGGPSPTQTDRGGTQPTAAACAEVSRTVGDAVAALQQVDPDDPSAAAAAMAAVGERVRAASDSVANAEVEALLPAMAEDLTEIGAALEKVAAGDLSQAAALSAPTQRLQRSFGAFRQLCSGS